MGACKFTQEMVALLSGDLTAEQDAEIQAHWPGCLACRKEKELLERSWQMAASYAPPALKDDFTASVMARVREEETEEDLVSIASSPGFSFEFLFAPFRLAPALALTVIAVLVFSSSLYYQLAKQKVDEPQVVKFAALAPVLEDKAVIQDLDLIEDFDLLADLDLYQDLDAIEKMDNNSVKAGGGRYA